jgi:hypothetical protein
MLKLVACHVHGTGAGCSGLMRGLQCTPIGCKMKSKRRGSVIFVEVDGTTRQRLTLPDKNSFVDAE